MASHDKISDDEKRWNSVLRKNKIEQSKRHGKRATIQDKLAAAQDTVAAIQAEAQMVDDELAALQAEEGKLRDKRERVYNEKKRLHDSLPDDLRTVLNFGRTLGSMEKNKRVKLDQDDVSDEDDA
jgi:uncharacterized protein (DUF3084 family)